MIILSNQDGVKSIQQYKLVLLFTLITISCFSSAKFDYRAIKLIFIVNLFIVEKLTNTAERSCIVRGGH